MLLRFVTVLALILLGACNYNVQTSAGNEALNAEVDAIVAEVVNGQDEAIVARMSSTGDPVQVRAQLPMLRGLVPPGPLPVGQVIGAQSRTASDGVTYAVSKTYPYPDRTARVDVTFIREGEAWKVFGFNINVQMNPGVAPQPRPAADAPAPAAPAA